ncbi:hypothetical protein WI29_17235 [Burkholderia ubonensis]|nr:hypothetical protein WI31_04040 [Burkholderia ubonensis]KUZ18002.1 hypothetical protein WI29_17235 [Burkholderia ubonensis]KUZ32315.1 hypothetical protein WI30_17350 [Burkholderia ubonensis]KUZ38790.1 hypothetical protein WI32_12140 [Burkholderia ubonensis]KUZ47965.1 hypothetical protein WI34_33875 [Burkholderia ubonensis]
MPVAFRLDAADQVDLSACQGGVGLRTRLEHPDLEAKRAGPLDGMEIIRGNPFVQAAVAIQVEWDTAVARDRDPHRFGQVRWSPTLCLHPVPLIAVQLQRARRDI